MNFLNAAAEATLSDAAALVSSGKGESLSITEALGISVTGIAVVMIILALLAVLVVILSKVIRVVEGASKKQKNKDKSKNTEEIKVPVSEKKAQNNTVTLDETQSAGNLELYKTDEKTAAVIMAIVSNESGIALNKLQFNSIRLIEK